jgi:class 3 adenylate cyclase
MAERDIDELAQGAADETRGQAFLEWAGAERRTLAIIFTDIVDSTALGRKLGDPKMLEVRLTHFAHSHDLIFNYGGCEIRTIGDSTMAAFYTAESAFEYARTLQDDPGRPELNNRVRAGIHIGPVDIENADVFGTTVNFAARVTSAIQGAEIWVCERTREDLRRVYGTDGGDSDWLPQRNLSMKGFPERQTLYAFRPMRSHVTSTGSGKVDYRPGALDVSDSTSRAEFNARAQNYDRVDFVSSAEVVIDQQPDGFERGLYAQVDFVERLYVATGRARIEFGVRRAFVTVENDGPGKLSRGKSLRTEVTQGNAYFVTLQEAPDAVTICMDPDRGKNSLAELALPPSAPKENYLCRIATATIDVESTRLWAELHVSLDVEGLYLADDIASKVSRSTKNQIKAIMSVAAQKNHQKVEGGEIRRRIEVTERGYGEV